MFPPMEKKSITFQTQKVTLKQKYQLQRESGGFVLKKKLKRMVGENQKLKIEHYEKINRMGCLRVC